MKKVFAIICALVVVLSLVACGSKNPLIGSWVYSDSEGLEALGGATSCVFKFIDDTHFEASVIYYGDVDSQSGTYTYDKNTLTITIDDSETTYTYIIHGKTLEIGYDGSPVTMTFTKK